MWNTMRRALGLSLVLAAATLSVNAYSIGDQGVQVLKIQKQLSQYGYRIKADGVYGGETARAASSSRQIRAWPLTASSITRPTAN